MEALIFHTETSLMAWNGTLMSGRQFIMRRNHASAGTTNNGLEKLLSTQRGLLVGFKPAFPAAHRLRPNNYLSTLARWFPPRWLSRCLVLLTSLSWFWNTSNTQLLTQMYMWTSSCSPKALHLSKSPSWEWPRMTFTVITAATKKVDQETQEVLNPWSPAMLES